MDLFDHDIDRLFNEGASNFEANPPSSGWDGLAAGLDRRQKRKKFFWLQIAAAFALLITAFGGGYYLGQQPLNPGLNAPIIPLTPIENQPPTAPAESIELDKNSEPVTSSPKTESVQEIDNPAKKSSKSSAATGTSSQAPKKTANIPLPPATAESGIQLNTPDPDPTSLAVVTDAVLKNQSSLDNIALATSNTTVDDEVETTKSFIDFDSEERNKSLESESEAGPTLALQSDATEMVLAYESIRPEDHFEKLSPWHIGLTAGPTSSFRVIDDPTLQPGGPNTSFNYSTADDQPIQSWAANLQAHYQLNHKWELNSGIGYIRYGQAAEPPFAYSVTDGFGSLELIGQSSAGNIEVSPQGESALLDESSIGTSGSLGQISTNQYFDYLEIPLTATYYLGHGSFKLGFEAGFAGNFLIKNQVVLAESGSRTILGNTENTQSFLLTAVGGLKLNYYLSNPLFFSLAPQIRYGLESISDQENFTPYSIGVQAGITYRL